MSMSLMPFKESFDKSIKCTAILKKFLQIKEHCTSQLALIHSLADLIRMVVFESDLQVLNSPSDGSKDLFRN